MTKSTVTRFFSGGLLAVLAGGILAVAAIWLAIANDAFVMNGPDIVAIHGGTLTWTLLGFAAVGGLIVLGGAVAGLIAWIGSLVNTSNLENKSWFLGLLLSGIFGFGFLAVIAYVLVGPDGTGAGAPRPSHAAIAATPA